MKPRLDQPLRSYWTYLPALPDGGFSRTSFRYWHPKRDRLDAEHEAWSAKQRLGADDLQYRGVWVVNYRLPARRGQRVEVIDAYHIDQNGHRMWGGVGGGSKWEAQLSWSRARLKG